MAAEGISRRGFLAASSAALTGIAVAAGSRRGGAESQTVRCGIVGVGNRGSALLRAALQVESIEMPVICDLDPAARTKAADAIEKARGKRPDETEDWKRLLARDDITAVIAALPCDLHHPMYRDAINAGKHVYGEKPLCLTVKHADELVQMVEASGKIFQIGFQRRFGAQLREPVKLFRDGITGPPFDGRGGRFSSEMLRKPGEWFSFRDRSGDWMLEQAVHNWDLLNWALGELPVSAYGAGRQDLFKEKDPKRDVSDYYTAVIRYKSGLPYTWVHSWLAPPHPQFTSTYEELIGPKAGIDFAKGLIALQRETPGDSRTQQVPAVEREDSTLLAMQAFIHSVHTGDQPIVGVREGRNATLFGLLVRKAVYEQRVVTMDEVLQQA